MPRTAESRGLLRRSMPTFYPIHNLIIRRSPVQARPGAPIAADSFSQEFSQRLRRDTTVIPVARRGPDRPGDGGKGAQRRSPFHCPVPLVPDPLPCEPVLPLLRFVGIGGRWMPCRVGTVSGSAGGTSPAAPA